MHRVDSTETDVGVSVVVGFILLFAIGMMAMAVYQQNTVPHQERMSEIDHHRHVQEQLSIFHQSTSAVANDGSPRTTTVNLGLTYGSGASPFVNSPPSAGRLAVKSYDSEIRISNAEGTDSGAAYWNGQTESYSASYFTYSPQYHHFYDAPDTRLGNGGLLYKDYTSATENGETVVQSSQSLVQDNAINIQMLSGDLAVSKTSEVTLRAEPVSASTNTVSVTNSGDPLTVTLPTRLGAEEWGEVLENELDENGGHVTNVEVQENADSNNEVTITFEEGVTYDLKMSKLHLTTATSNSQTPSTDAAYAAWSGNDDVTIREDSTLPVDARALDRYNNPVSGEPVVAEAVDVSSGSGEYNYPGGSNNSDCYGGFRTGPTYEDSRECDNGASDGTTFYQRGIVNSASSGDVTFLYQAPDVEGDVSIEFRVCLQKYIDREAVDECADIDDGDDDGEADDRI